MAYVEEKRMAQGHFIHPQGGHHACEILGRGPEAEESEAVWNRCKKNPRHEEFISAQEFKDNYLPRVNTVKNRDRLRALIDLTVRLRVNWTSRGRPDGHTFSHVRGSDKLRVGTGFIYHVKGPVFNKSCFCDGCRGKIATKSWRFRVRTAHHVVYDTQEAKKTKVDLFYDDDNCEPGGKMETVSGLEVVRSRPDKDICDMLCVTHDETLAERIESTYQCWLDRPSEHLDADFLPSWGRNADPALVVSHPHAQPKKITLGELRDGGYPYVEYNAATCPGSSGAPVFVSDTEGRFYQGLLPPVHSGGFTTSSTQHGHQLSKLGGQETKLEQRNYANWWLL
ncbi:hypothetical protein EGW08_018631 [Elysia chlorotica]|uniref:Peptidase S1 domain-containing protein n=1 Tax=Elysia chlorotica TaxID=188477 RepID=A0A433SWH5_ELYCH|nr:hypothetical protein EGW08_018631 [Elysia chlorotica]